MPTVLKIGSYRFFFYSNESDEPAHIHVEREDKEAKFWLVDVRLASSYGFTTHELNKIKQMVVENKRVFLEKWYEYFTS
ncbi:DUF4160 domain-containing protein [Caedibacter taeniospiralis]|uniref:DUF4160 domain-containing protein n=1 Tax=Caedibacter taeniospiralis TaxID=28907 RepID=UPI000C27AA5D|nr:DUF4160 domain-containing protein [Caedibacter taeniospiralis]